MDRDECAGYDVQSLVRCSQLGTAARSHCGCQCKPTLAPVAVQGLHSLTPYTASLMYFMCGVQGAKPWNLYVFFKWSFKAAMVA